MDIPLQKVYNCKSYFASIFNRNVIFIMDGKGKISSGNKSIEMMASTCWWKNMEELTRILEELVDEITEASLNITEFVNRKF